MDVMHHWYVVYTKPRKEHEADLQLKRQGFDTCLPLLRHTVRRRDCWVERIDPLFPRYLFISLKLNQDNIAPIRSTRGVIDLVRFGNRPSALPSGFVEGLHQAHANTEDNTVYEQLRFERGQLVEILSGPFAGIQARFDLETSENRVCLLLDMLGRNHRINLERHQIAPAI